MDFTEEYKRWDEFLAKWPLEKLEQMTLEEYTNAGSKDSFTYWIEAKLENLGSIWGGSAFKFGVYARNNTESKENTNRIRYSDTHGWYTMLGNSAEKAFAKVKSCIIQTAQLVRQGKLKEIDTITELGDAYKWKLAFHYQDRQSPSIVCVFTKAALQLFLGTTDNNNSIAELQQMTVAQCPANLGILEFSRQVWEYWASKKLKIWKLSHGKDSFTLKEKELFLQRGLAVMYRKTHKKQGDNFVKVPKGSLFYLCFSNEKIVLLGQFTSDVEPCNKGDGWLQRKYRVLKQATKEGYYVGDKKGWTPNYNSTFSLVSENHLSLFENKILTPFFDINLAELAELKENYEDLYIEKELETQELTENDQSITNAENIIFYGPPGTGKTYQIMQLREKYQPKDTEDCRYKTVTFHQSFGYEEFIEGLRPVLKENNNSKDIQYEIKDGIFKALCKRAIEAPDKRFAIFIDEINRGNISKIFGELISLIEVDKRDNLDGTNCLTVTLPYSQESFSVPANVDIIGTMNTADQSLTRLDTALRRRFDFIPLYPDSSLLADITIYKEGVNINLQQLLEAINQRIELLYDKDHCIGHAYFMPIQEIATDDEKFDALKAIFQKKIIPLLEEYFFEDWQKIHLVLADNQKPKEAQFIQLKPIITTNLFGNNDIEFNESNYSVNNQAFENVKAYHLIYK